jgi:hypothetical protein
VLFNVEQDLGNRIVGYLVTDSYSGRGSVRISSEGYSIAVVDAGEPIDALVAAGRHETGRCGFVIDVPGLGTLNRLEIRDADSGLLIYRRAPEAEFVTEKVFRLETNMIPLRRVDRAARRRFSYAYCDAERFGLESMTQMFHLPHAQSLYLSARCHYPTFESFVQNRFKLICVIHDPFEELAERLLLFRRAAARGRLNARDALIFKAAIEFAAGLAPASDRELRRSFGRIGYDAVRPLHNPLVRQLATANLQELPRSGSLTMALDILASFALVGLRSESEQFAAGLSALLGATGHIVRELPRCTAAIELATRLRQIPAVHDLLELDIELYGRIAEAYRNAARGLSLPGGGG